MLGLFNYPTPDVGPDASNEIDIEFARWGNRQNPMGNYTVYPAVPGPKPTSYAFEPHLNGDYSTHRFNWSASRVLYHRCTAIRTATSTKWRAGTSPRHPTRLVPQQPLPPHINLWLFQDGRPRTARKWRS